MDKVSTRKKEKKYYYYYCCHCNKRINQDKLLYQVLPEAYDHLDLLNDKEKSRKTANKIKQINFKMNEQYEAYLLNKIGVKAYMMTMSRLSIELESYESAKESRITTISEWTTLSDLAKRQFLQGIIQYVIVDLDLQRAVQIELI